MLGKRRIGSFKDRHFTSEVILRALRWYLAFPISYRDLASMLSDRGVEVDQTTLFRWVQAYAFNPGNAGQAAPAAVQQIVAGGRDLHQGQRRVDLALSCRGQPGSDD